MSVDDSVAQLIMRIHSSMDRLRQIWDGVGMDQKTRDCRTQTAYIHFYTLLDDIVQAEEDMASGVASDIEAHRLAVADLRSMFQMPKFNEERYAPGSISLLKALDKELSMLSKRRDEVVASQVQEYEMVRELCFRLDIDPPVHKDISLNILPKNELKELENRRKEMCKQVNHRLKTAVHLQSMCRKMYTPVRKSVTCTAEQENLLNTDFTVPFSIVSDVVLQALEDLHQYLETEYNSWLDQISFQYAELMIQLKELSTKCVCSDQYSKVYPDNFDIENQSLEDIEKLSAEMVAIMEEKLELEHQASCPNFYNNRGGQLNVFLKRQKQIAVAVPQALKELNHAVHMYLEEEDNAVEDLLVEEGILPEEYVQYLIKQHEDHKQLRLKKLESSAKCVAGQITTPFKSPASRRILATTQALTLSQPPESLD
uniref:Protein regulator of cytokinesis 1 n=1 Tax=Ditylenchus dipsaci TaxID=166011 RepID=A0A915E1U6_9BILA